MATGCGRRRRAGGPGQRFVQAASSSSPPGILETLDTRVNHRVDAFMAALVAWVTRSSFYAGYIGVYLAGIV